MLSETALEFPKLARLRFGPLSFYLVSHPAYIQHVLQDNQRNYRRGIGYALMKPVVGEGLITSDGEMWLRHRRLLQPVFNRNHVAAFDTLIARETGRMFARWENFIDRGQALDLATEFVRLERGISGQILFSQDVNAPGSELGQVFERAGKIGENITANSTSGVVALLRGLEILPYHPSRDERDTLAELDRVIYALIEARRKNAEADDLLTHMLNLHDERTGATFSPKEIRDELVTLFLAGTDTAAVALTWAVYLLDQNPLVEERLHAELSLHLGERIPTSDDLTQLPYSRMVVDETLRLYPSGWMFLRDAVADDVLDNWRIPRGSIMLISPYATQRQPALWPNPDAFEPERFTAKRTAERHRFAYLPFGGGPRQCIGMHLALTELQIVLAALVSRYRLRLVPDHPIATAPLITLRPRYGLKMTVTRRPQALSVSL